MENIDIIALLLTIIAIFVAIWIFRRVLVIVAILIIIGVIAYLFMQNGEDLTPREFNNQKQTDLLERFKDNYCDLLYDRDDSLICVYIVEPIYNDIVRNYDLDSVRSLDRSQFIHLIVEVAKKNKGVILRNLKKNDALYLWQDFVDDIKHQNLF